jgi:putative spermidine/putrescine transport system ATP-binding protein
MYIDINVRKKYPDMAIDASLQVSKGEFVTILGPSGSGKTTLLQIIAGILPMDYGRIALNGADISNLAPEKRNFGFVFQEKLLFPHLSVLENVKFGLKMRGLDGAKAIKIMELFGMRKFSNRSVNELSGGELQRVAIARAIAYGPQLLLLDEPLKELDALVKEKIKWQLKKLAAKNKITTIYVTHDVEEAFDLSDRICVMHGGRIVQVGSPLEVFQNPVNSFVKRYFSPYQLIWHSNRFLIARKSNLNGKKII